MLRFYKARLGFLWILLGILLVGTQFLYAQCPDIGLTVSPGPTTICSGTGVAVTIDSPEPDVLYQLRDDDTNAPLSGYFSGTGPNLTINSDALGSDVTIKVTALNPIVPCPPVDLTDVVVVTAEQTPTVADAGGNQTFCGTTVTLSADPAVIGTGVWSFAPGGNPDTLPLTAFGDTSSPTSGFTGTPGKTYLLTMDYYQWSLYAER